MQDQLLKLTNIVYNLLEYFPENDPLKNKAKEKALAIMDNLVSEDIDMLLNYFKLAELQGWISKINYLIISNEYEKIKKEIIVGKGAQAGSNSVLNKEKAGLSARQGKIISFLQKNEKAQVMDLQTVLPDVTKRTIRRDLDELLKIGKIVRTGEWNQVFYKMSYQ